MLFEALTESKAKNDKYAQNMFDIYIKQRQHFFNLRMEEIRKKYNLNNTEEKTLWAYLLASEQTDRTKDMQSYRIFSSLHRNNKEQELLENTNESLIILNWLYIYWTKAWLDFSEAHKYTLAARYVLIKMANKEDKHATISTAEDDLVSELKRVLDKAEKMIGLPLEDNYFVKPEIDKNGILELDKKVLEYFKQNNIGAGTKDAIKNFKSIIDDANYNIEKRLESWEDPLFFAKKIAATRWLDLIRRYVHNKQEKPAALTYPFAIQISRTLTKGSKLNSEGNKIVDSHGKVISGFDQSACMPVTTVEGIIRSNIPLLSSITARYSVRWLMIQGHKQHLLDIKNPNMIIIDGGYPKLGELSGAGTANSVVDKIKKILSLLSGCGYEYEGKYDVFTGNLLMFEHRQAKGQNSSTLTITLSRVLCPGLIEDLPQANRLDRMLIPVVSMPTFVGRTNEHGSQASFQDVMLIEMRLRASEIYENGGILLNDDSLKELAKKAKMPISLIPKVLDCWIQNNFLEKVDDYIFNIGNRYPEARMMLFEAGEKIIKGSIAGKKRKTLRQKKYMN